MKRLLIILCTAALGGQAFAQIRDRYDVVVAGAGTGGCGAAIQAARLGASVLLLEETDYIGGQMNAAAVTSMDEGGTLVRGRGLYRELVQRIEAHYRPLGIDPETAYQYGHICVEPRVGRKILHEMLQVEKIDLSLRSRVTKVTKAGDIVTGVEIAIVSGKGTTTQVVQSRVLIDATEWGDVIPMTGARYRVGNCLSDAIDPAQRVQDNTWTAVIKKYPGAVPVAFRLAEKPPGYTDKIHQRFVKTLKLGDEVGTDDRPWSWARFIGYRGMPNSAEGGGTRPITRTHVNFNNDWPSSVAEIEDPAKRRATERDMRLMTLHLLYYIQNTLGLQDWAVADDEGYDTAYNRAEIDAWLKERPDLAPYRTLFYHFPVIPYVRESRRIVGLHTLCAREIDRRPGHQPVQFENSVAIGDYPVDMHGSMQTRYLELDLDREEDIPDKFGSKGHGPFAIPFECFIPEKVDGFLPAEKNISQSRMGNGATRLQPHTMLMGQAAGAIAALAVRHGVQPRAVSPVLVQDMLAHAHGPLTYTPVQDVASDKPDWPAIQMVTVRGLLPLEAGKFAPRRVMTAAEAATILAPAKLAGPVTRGTFAAAMTEAAKAAKVRIEFHAADTEKAVPITRSEAAQITAEYLVLRAKALMQGQEQTLVWDSVRPASEPAAYDVTSTTFKDLQKLLERKLVSSVDYWIKNAVVGGRCDGEKVALMMLRAARLFDPAVKPAGVLDVMVRERIISTASYWQKTAVPGGVCDGKNVAIVLRNMVKATAAAK
ncbi:MAG: FAD-dependent oxidoreductase [Prosthecobacter sp.]